MSEFATPGGAVSARTAGWPTGLTGSIGVAVLRESDRSVVTARSTSGITEDTGGTYRVTLTAPPTAGEYLIVWTDAAATLTAEEELVVAAGPAVGVGAQYVTSAELKQTLTLTGQTFADADVALAVEAASRGVDDACGRRFWLDADANQVRYYDATDPWVCRIDDLVELTGVAVDSDGSGSYDQAWTLGVDFTLTPVNAQADGRPWELLNRHPNGRYILPTSWPQTVRVTGRFGWPAVPPGVKHATSILAARLLKRAREAPFGVAALGIDAGTGMMHSARVAARDPDLRFLLSGVQRGGRGFV